MFRSHPWCIMCILVEFRRMKNYYIWSWCIDFRWDFLHWSSSSRAHAHRHKQNFVSINNNAYNVILLFVSTLTLIDNIIVWFKILDIENHILHYFLNQRFLVTKPLQTIYIFIWTSHYTEIQFWFSFSPNEMNQCSDRRISQTCWWRVNVVIKLSTEKHINLVNA